MNKKIKVVLSVFFLLLFLILTGYFIIKKQVVLGILTSIICFVLVVLSVSSINEKDVFDETEEELEII